MQSTESNEYKLEKTFHNLFKLVKCCDINKCINEMMCRPQLVKKVSPCKSNKSCGLYTSLNICIFEIWIMQSGYNLDVNGHKKFQNISWILIHSSSHTRTST